MQHQPTRVRHELKRRRLTVQEVAHLTPRMVRIIFEGDELADFISAAPDDHVKLFFPTGEGEPERRDYTPRAFDQEKRTLTIDFAMHDAGPATDWARRAKAGDAIEIGGPRGSYIVAPDFDWHLLVGDETALPAMGRHIEEQAGRRTLLAVAAVTGPEEQQAFEGVELRWVHRPEAEVADPEALLAALRELRLPAGDGFVWIAAEAGVARRLRAHVLEEMGHPPAWLKASGYWVQGRANATEKFDG